MQWISAEIINLKLQTYLSNRNVPWFLAKTYSDDNASWDGTAFSQ